MEGMRNVLVELAEEAKADMKENIRAFISQNLIKFLPLGAIIFLCLYCCCCCRGGGGTRKMMRAPGRNGAFMPRSSFDSNPKGYFRGLRSKDK